MKLTLSNRQQQIFEFICQYHKDNGFSPSIADIASGLGLANSSVVAPLKALELKGYISKKANIPRSIKPIMQ